MEVLILYASTSGSTRFVVDALIDELGAPRVESRDVAALEKRLSHSQIAISLCSSHLHTAPATGTTPGKTRARCCSPTCRRNRAWLCWPLVTRAATRNPSQAAWPKLAALARSKHATLVGAVSAADYTYEASPAIENGTFPGLVVEYRRNRHAATKMAREWVRGLVVTVTVSRELEPEGNTANG